MLSTGEKGITYANPLHAVKLYVEDFEHPICQICIGTGWVRDENGIHMVRCDYCEGKGRAPAPE